MFFTQVFISLTSIFSAVLKVGSLAKSSIWYSWILQYQLGVQPFNSILSLTALSKCQTTQV